MPLAYSAARSGEFHSRAVILSEAEGSAVVFAITAQERTLRYHPGMHAGSYCTYIVASQSRTLYIGVTGDLHRRVWQHKWKEFDGFTDRYQCDRLVWFETQQEVTKAIAREKQLNGWTRAKKITLIERLNPAWVDLSRDWYEVEPRDYKRAFDRMDV